MAMFLLILEIIGIVIAAMLGFLILILAIVIFVPFKYNAFARKDDNLHIDAKISWLFSIISVQYKLDDGVDDLIIKIPFFSKRHKSPNDNAEASDPLQDSTVAEVYLIEDDGSLTKKEPVKKKSQKNTPKKAAKEGIFDSFFRKIRQVFKDIKNAVNEMIKYKNKAKEFDSEFGIKKTVKATYSFVQKLLYIIEPRELDVNVVFGFDTPDTTGAVLGLLCAMKMYLPGNYYINGDFQGPVFKGNAKMNGKTRLLHIIKPTLEFVRTEPISDIIKKYRR